MKRLENIGINEYLIVDFLDGLREPAFLTKRDFLNSKYYQDKELMKIVYTTKEEYAYFDLGGALDDLETICSMYDGWGSDIYSLIPTDVVQKIEKEINKYTKETPTYVRYEEVEW